MAPAAIVGSLFRGRATVVQTLVISIASGRRPLLPSSPLAATSGPLGSSASALSRPQSFAFSSTTPVEDDAGWGDPRAREGDFSERDDERRHRASPPESQMGARLYPRMRPGDWVCPRCSFMNFARNSSCLGCRGEGPAGKRLASTEMREGDWTCPDCNFMNFRRNTTCLQCRKNRPDNIHPDLEADRRSFLQHSSFGRMDWVCPKCDYVNFGRNSTCLRCEDSRPSIQLKDGEWECPLCKFLNFARNSYCLKCNHSRPEAAKTKEDHLSSTPVIASEKSPAESYEESSEFKDDDGLFGDEGNLLSDNLRKDEDSNKY